MSGWRPAIGHPDVGGQFNRATADDTLGAASDSATYIIHPALHYHYRYHISVTTRESGLHNDEHRDYTKAQPGGRSIYLFPKCRPSPPLLQTLDS